MFGIVSIITICLTVLLTRLDTASNKKGVYQIVLNYGEEIGQSLNKYIYTTKLLEEVIVSDKGYVQEELFKEIAQSLDNEKAIRTIQYLQDGAVKYCYALDGNEELIGNDILKRQDKKRNDLIAKKLDKEIISEPMTLKNEDLGIIVTNPVYLTRDNGEKVFLGFVEIVLDLNDILNEVRLYSLNDQGLLYQLSVSGDEEDIFIEGQFDNRTLKNYIEVEIPVDSVNWKLKIYPENGWNNTNMSIIYLFISLLISSLMVNVHFYRREESKLLKEIENDEKILKIALQMGKIEAFKYSFITKRLILMSEENEDRLLSDVIENVPESLVDSFIYPESMEEFLNMYEKIANGDKTASCIIKVNMRETFAWERVTLVDLSSEDDKKDNIIGIIEDVTKEKENHENLLKEKMLKSSMKVNAHFYIEANITKNEVLILGDEMLISSNRLDYESFMEEHILSIIHPDDVEAVMKAVTLQNMKKQFYEKNVNLFEIEYRHLGGEFYNWAIAKVHLIEFQDELNVVIMSHNIQEKKEEEQKLRYKAEVDSLTGILNRGAIESRIQETIKHVSSMNALFIFDLDNFKNINDKMGHMQGDLVLKDVGTVLKSVFSSTDLIGRLGGDEFIVLMKDLKDIESVKSIASKLLQLLEKTYEKNGESITISASIGIALSPYCGTTFRELYNVADKALYDVKESNKNAFKVITNMKF